MRLRELLDSSKGLFLKGILIWSIAIGVPLYVANNVLSNYHLKQVLKAVEISEEAMNDYKESVDLTKSSDGCFMAGKRVGRIYCGMELNSWVADLYAPNSGELKMKLQSQSYLFSTMEPFPFGGEFSEPIARYRNHLEAWINRLSILERCETLTCATEDAGKNSDINSSFVIAGIAFSNALPSPSYFGSKEKIELIFEE